jgi:hypothetical protein
MKPRIGVVLLLVLALLAVTLFASACAGSLRAGGTLDDGSKFKLQVINGVLTLEEPAFGTAAGTFSLDCPLGKFVGSPVEWGAIGYQPENGYYHFSIYGPCTDSAGNSSYQFLVIVRIDAQTYQQLLAANPLPKQIKLDKFVDVFINVPLAPEPLYHGEGYGGQVILKFQK